MVFQKFAASELEAFVADDVDVAAAVLEAVAVDVVAAVDVAVAVDDDVTFFKLVNAFTAVDEATSAEGYGIMNAPVAERSTFGLANAAFDTSLASDVGPNELTPRGLHLFNKLLSNVMFCPVGVEFICHIDGTVCCTELAANTFDESDV